MYKDALTAYQDLLSNLTGIEKYITSDQGVTILGVGTLLVVIMTILTTLMGLASFTALLFPKSGISLSTTYKEARTKMRESKKGDPITALVYAPRLILPLSVLFSALTLISINMGHQAHDIKVEAGESLKGVRDAVFEDYLTTYNGEVFVPKESLSSTRLKNNELYTTSFNLNNEHYNNVVIYVTYTDKYPSDVLIPFNPENYPELHPTESQVKYNDKNGSTTPSTGVVGEAGYLFLSRSTQLSLGVRTYLTDVDYIYNIKINEKGNKETTKNDTNKTN